jgi:hypothetical protein
MQATELIRTTIPSKQADLRDVPLAEIPGLSTVTRNEVPGRVIPDSQMAPVPGAAFSSAI